MIEGGGDDVPLPPPPAGVAKRHPRGSRPTGVGVGFGGSMGSNSIPVMSPLPQVCNQVPVGREGVVVDDEGDPDLMNTGMLTLRTMSFYPTATGGMLCQETLQQHQRLMEFGDPDGGPNAAGWVYAQPSPTSEGWHTVLTRGRSSQAQPSPAGPHVAHSSRKVSAASGSRFSAEEVVTVGNTASPLPSPGVIPGAGAARPSILQPARSAHSSPKGPFLAKVTKRVSGLDAAGSESDRSGSPDFHPVLPAREQRRSSPTALLPTTYGSTSALLNKTSAQPVNSLSLSLSLGVGARKGEAGGDFNVSGFTHTVSAGTGVGSQGLRAKQQQPAGGRNRGPSPTTEGDTAEDDDDTDDEDKHAAKEKALVARLFENAPAVPVPAAVRPAGAERIAPAPPGGSGAVVGARPTTAAPRRTIPLTTEDKDGYETIIGGAPASPVETPPAPAAAAGPIFVPAPPGSRAAPPGARGGDVSGMPAALARAAGPGVHRPTTARTGLADTAGTMFYTAPGTAPGSTGDLGLGARGPSTTGQQQQHLRDPAAPRMPSPTVDAEVQVVMPASTVGVAAPGPSAVDRTLSPGLSSFSSGSLKDEQRAVRRVRSRRMVWAGRGSARTTQPQSQAHTTQPQAARAGTAGGARSNNTGSRGGTAPAGGTRKSLGGSRSNSGKRGGGGRANPAGAAAAAGGDKDKQKASKEKDADAAKAGGATTAVGTAAGDIAPGSPLSAAALAVGAAGVSATNSAHVQKLRAKLKALERQSQKIRQQIERSCSVTPEDDAAAAAAPAPPAAVLSRASRQNLKVNLGGGGKSNERSASAPKAADAGAGGKRSRQSSPQTRPRGATARGPGGRQPSPRGRGGKKRGGGSPQHRAAAAPARGVVQTQTNVKVFIPDPHAPSPTPEYPRARVTQVTTVSPPAVTEGDPPGSASIVPLPESSLMGVSPRVGGGASSTASHTHCRPGRGLTRIPSWVLLSSPGELQAGLPSRSPRMRAEKSPKKSGGGKNANRGYIIAQRQEKEAAALRRKRENELKKVTALARTLQQWYRDRRRIRHQRALARVHRLKAIAARLIQRVARGRRGRTGLLNFKLYEQRQADTLRKERHAAAVAIQKHVKAWFARQQYHALVGTRREARVEAAAMRRAEEALALAATDIQALWRMYATRKRVAPIIDFRKVRVATTLQRWYRECLRLRAVEEHIAERRAIIETATVRIQCGWRAVRARREAHYRRTKLRLQQQQQQQQHQQRASARRVSGSLLSPLHGPPADKRSARC